MLRSMSGSGASETRGRQVARDTRWFQIRLQNLCVRFPNNISAGAILARDALPLMWGRMRVLRAVPP